MKKALTLLLTLSLIITSFTTVSFAAASVSLYLDVYKSDALITPNNEDGFEVVLYTDETLPAMYTYQIGIDYDSEYFELDVDSIKSKVTGSVDGIKAVDNEKGKADFAYYIGSEKLTSDKNDDDKYPIAVFTFKTLKTVDKDLEITINEERTTLLDKDGQELDFELNDLKITIPEIPHKTSPSSNKFTQGTILRLATTPRDAEIYVATSEGSPLDELYKDGIRLPTRNITYYVVARKYGISSSIGTIKMTFQGSGIGGSTSGNGGGSRPSGGYYPTTNTTTQNNTNTNANTTPEKYADIKGHWAESYVKDLIDKKIINGYEDGTIKPANTVTRAEVAKIIVCALGQSEAGSVTLDFADAGQIADWAKGYIQTAVNLGILNGYEDNTFKPTQPVTRQELAKIAMVAFKMGESQKALTFADKDKIPAWSVGYISAAVENGIITGYEDNTFNPTGNVTRAEICTIVSKCLNK